MLKKEEFAVIQALAKRGVNQKDIAADLGGHPKTVSRALRRGAAPAPERRPRGSRLDPFKEQIDQLLAEGVWNAVVILREIQAHGYTGRDTILREYIAPKRALRPSRATVRFETAPGQQLQSDWGEIVTEVAGRPTKVYFIVNQLGFSRRFHFWCAPRLDAEHTYEGLIRSLEYFGGVPQEVLYDYVPRNIIDRDAPWHPAPQRERRLVGREKALLPHRRERAHERLERVAQADAEDGRLLLHAPDPHHGGAPVALRLRPRPVRQRHETQCVIAVRCLPLP